MLFSQKSILAPAAALFLAASPALAQAGPFGPLGQDVDYVFPTKDLASRAAAAHALPGPALFGGEKVIYQAFDGKSYELTRFKGRFVQILLPDTWLGNGALTEDLVHLFVDRSDIVYSQFADFIRSEPAGEGLLTVAVVPAGATCGWACGLIGTKGLEIADYPGLDPILWREIAADKGVSVLVHEMTHNFDVYWPYLYYLPGHPHAWTDFVNLYLFVYNRSGTADGPPKEVEQHWLETTGRYFADPAATWASCVRDGACEDRGITANNAWGGFGFRIALFYGPRSARAAMAFLKSYAQTHPPPATPEAKEDLYVEALANGAGQNLACFLNAWHWYASPGLRHGMRLRWGMNNPFCQDQDGDGMSPLRGDCDDRRSAVRPGAPELWNAMDDDCDGMGNEISCTEPPSGDFPPLRRLEIPAEVSGQIAGGGDFDRFLFPIEKPRRVRIGICSPAGFDGWLLLYGAEGEVPAVQYVSAGICSRTAYELAPGRHRFEVSGSIPGSYTLDVTPTPPWPAPPWAQTAPPAREGDAWALTAAPVLPLPAGTPLPTAVRFWVSGQGIVGTVPYAPAVTLTWTPPPGFAPEGAAYRVQLLSRSVPATEYTPPRPFAP